MILMEGQDYNIHFTNKLPPHIGGCTYKNDDSTFDIYINERLEDNLKREVFGHEIAHIARDHFDDDIKSDEQKEMEADMFTIKWEGDSVSEQ